MWEITPLEDRIKQNGKGIDSIGFDLGGMLDEVGPGAMVDAAFVPMMNEWDGAGILQLTLSRYVSRRIGYNRGE